MIWSELAQVPVGGYISVWKALPAILLLLLWARLLTWADKDAEPAHLPRQELNISFLAGLIGGYAFFIFGPAFAISFPVLLFVFLLEVGVYLYLRAQKVGLADVKHDLKNLFTFQPKEKLVAATAGAVQVINRAGNPMPVPTAEDPTRPAYDAVQRLLTEPLLKEAERIDMAPAEGMAVARYVVDGMPYQLGSMSKPEAALAIEYVKGAAGMDLEEKRKPQTGKVKTTLDGKRIELDIQTAGSTAGEVIRLVSKAKPLHTQRLEQLGLNDEQFGHIIDLIRENTGVVILSAPKGQGLTTLSYAILRAHDAFLTHIHTVERDAPLDLEGITQNKVGNQPGEESKQVEWIISQEPETIAVPLVEETATAVALAKYAGERRVYVGLRANSTFEALAQWRKLVGDDKLAMKNLRLVVNGRVMRTLCDACKVGYAPDPNTLRKLGLNSTVETLYQARTEPMRDPKGMPIPCTFCHDLHYRGRIGFYETLEVDDRIREVIETGGSIEQLKAAFRRQRGKYLQETALQRVEAGQTSIQEVLRVLKPEGSAKPRQKTAS